MPILFLVIIATRDCDDKGEPSVGLFTILKHVTIAATTSLHEYGKPNEKELSA